MKNWKAEFLASGSAILTKILNKSVPIVCVHHIKSLYEYFLRFWPKVTSIGGRQAWCARGCGRTRELMWGRSWHFELSGGFFVQSGRLLHTRTSGLRRCDKMCRQIGIAPIFRLILQKIGTNLEGPVLFSVCHPVPRLLPPPPPVLEERPAGRAHLQGARTYRSCDCASICAHARETACVWARVSVLRGGYEDRGVWKLTEGARCALAGRARPRAPARNHQEDYKVFHKRSNADHLQVDSVPPSAAVPLASSAFIVVGQKKPFGNFT